MLNVLKWIVGILWWVLATWYTYDDGLADLVDMPILGHIHPVPLFLILTGLSFAWGSLERED